MPSITVLVHSGPPILLAALEPSPPVYVPGGGGIAAPPSIPVLPPSTGGGTIQVINFGTQSALTVPNGTVDGQSAVVSDNLGQVSPDNPKIAYGTFNIGTSLPFNLRYQSYLLVWSIVDGCWIVS